MKRKLIKQGAGGLTITVPRDWAKDNNLEAGAEVDISTSGPTMNITTGPSAGKKEINIEAATYERLLRSNIWELYRKGYDTIVIIYKTEKQKRYIQDTVEMSLLGFEITKIKNKEITIENVTGPSAEKLEALQRRVFLLVKETLQLLEKDLKQGKPVHRAQVEKLSPKVLQYVLFCQRTLIAKKNTHIWFLYTRLSTLQGRLRMVYQQKDFDVSENVVNISTRMRESYEEIYKAFYNKSQTDIEKAALHAELLRKDLLKELKTTQQTETLYYMGETTRNLFLLATTVSMLLFE